MSETRLVGRSSSHFTRVAALFAHELGVPYTLEVLHDLTSREVAKYGGHPAFKIPTLLVGDSAVFGTENICRKLTELAGRTDDPDVVFIEHTPADLSRCAQELVWHAMAAQVQLVMGTVVGGLPPANPFFVKTSDGLRGALSWLESHLEEALRLLPEARQLSVFEVSLFCLVEHLTFRKTTSIERYEGLRRFALDWGVRASAQRTAFKFDPT